MSDILTTAKAADLLGVSVRTAQLWVESGRIPSWKTPGGHRRIPRQAVLDLIKPQVEESASVRPLAVIVTDENRALQWQEAGLRGSGLTIEVVQVLDEADALLNSSPPALIVVDSADQPRGRQLVKRLARDERLRASVIFGLVAEGPHEATSRNTRYVQLTSSPEIRATSAAIVEHLLARLPATNDLCGYRVPWNEPARLNAVAGSGLVSSAAEESFDRLVRLATYATGTPIGMFTLLTETEQWFKSHIGFEAASTPRDWAFCNETLISNELTIFEDLSKTKMFEQNPALAEPFGFRFYAGAPVRDPLGFVLGSICVIDVVPRKLTAEEQEALTTIADATSNLIRLKALERL